MERVEIVIKPDTKLVIKIDEFKGHQLINIRKCWKPADKNEFLPTKDGCTIPLSKLEEFKVAVAQLTTDRIVKSAVKKAADENDEAPF